MIKRRELERTAGAPPSPSVGTPNTEDIFTVKFDGEAGSTPLPLDKSTLKLLGRAEFQEPRSKGVHHAHNLQGRGAAMTQQDTSEKGLASAGTRIMGASLHTTSLAGRQGIIASHSQVGLVFFLKSGAVKTSGSVKSGGVNLEV